MFLKLLLPISLVFVSSFVFATDSSNVKPLSSPTPMNYQANVASGSSDCVLYRSATYEINAANGEWSWNQGNTPWCPEGYAAMRSGGLNQITESTLGGAAVYALRGIQQQVYIYCCPFQYNWKP